MKKFTAFILAFITALTVMVNPALAVPPPEKNAMWVFADGETIRTFNDIRDDEAVALCHRLGIVSGYGDWRFRPRQPITRVEFARMAYNLLDGRPIAPSASAAPWWAPTQAWAEGVTFGWYVTPALSTTLEKDLRNHYRYKDGTPESGDWDRDPSTGVTPEWAITELYLMVLGSRLQHPNENFREDALKWAADHDVRVDDAGGWRHDLPQDGWNCISRGDACRLFVQLFGLTEASEVPIAS